jgi:hypothetical protein
LAALVALVARALYAANGLQIVISGMDEAGQIISSLPRISAAPDAAPFSELLDDVVDLAPTLLGGPRICRLLLKFHLDLEEFEPSPIKSARQNEEAIMAFAGGGGVERHCSTAFATIVWRRLAALCGDWAANYSRMA